MTKKHSHLKHEIIIKLLNLKYFLFFWFYFLFVLFHFALVDVLGISDSLTMKCLHYLEKRYSPNYRVFEIAVEFLALTVTLIRANELLIQILLLYMNLFYGRKHSE